MLIIILGTLFFSKICDRVKEEVSESKTSITNIQDEEESFENIEEKENPGQSELIRSS